MAMATMNGMREARANSLLRLCAAASSPSQQAFCAVAYKAEMQAEAAGKTASEGARPLA